jgi:GTP pyrophosphokinase
LWAGEKASSSRYILGVMTVLKSKSSQATTPVANPAAANATAASFAGLTAKLDYLSAADLAQVRQAYRFADEAHLGQIRNSGEPYITHPIAVAAQCADWKLDAQALMAALLHDALEDCSVTKIELIERFGSPVAGRWPNQA